MNAELIERIDDCIYNRSGQSLIKSCKVIIDCKVEIERLESELQKAREYVLMTDDELNFAARHWYKQAGHGGFVQYIEPLVIQRANLEVKP